MMKANLVFHYWMHALVGALLVVGSGCASQNPEAPAISPVETQTQTYEHMFDIAVKAMDKMGTVQTANRDSGTILGLTPSGVTLEVLFLREGGRAPQMQVQALLPEGMTGMGDISEPDRYLDIYRKLSRR